MVVAFSLDVTAPGWALGYVFDIVPRGRIRIEGRARGGGPAT
jgi:hypothetical protein